MNTDQLSTGMMEVLVSNVSGEWWLYFWLEANKNFVTLRALTEEEVLTMKQGALPEEKAVLYFSNL